MNSNELVKVNGTTGAVVRHDSLPAAVLKWAMALSFSGQRLFVAGDLNKLPVLLVYDAATMTLIASLAVPASQAAECYFNCWKGAITLDEPSGKVFYTLSTDNGVTTKVYEFDILPEPWSQ